MSTATDLVGIAKGFALTGAVAMELLSGSPGAPPSEVRTDVSPDTSYSRRVDAETNLNRVVQDLCADFTQAHNTQQDLQEQYAAAEELKAQEQQSKQTRHTA